METTEKASSREQVGLAAEHPLATSPVRLDKAHLPFGSTRPALCLSLSAANQMQPTERDQLCSGQSRWTCSTQSNRKFEHPIDQVVSELDQMEPQ